jgi:hypothetical protein
MDVQSNKCTQHSRGGRTPQVARALASSGKELRSLAFAGIARSSTASLRPWTSHFPAKCPDSMSEVQLLAGGVQGGCLAPNCSPHGTPATGSSSCIWRHTHMQTLWPYPASCICPTAHLYVQPRRHPEALSQCEPSEVPDPAEYRGCVGGEEGGTEGPPSASCPSLVSPPAPHNQGSAAFLYFTCISLYFYFIGNCW